MASPVCAFLLCNVAHAKDARAARLMQPVPATGTVTINRRLLRHSERCLWS